jgi:hypothetical protein
MKEWDISIFSLYALLYIPPNTITNNYFNLSQSCALFALICVNSSQGGKLPQISCRYTTAFADRFARRGGDASVPTVGLSMGVRAELGGGVQVLIYPPMIVQLANGKNNGT